MMGKLLSTSKELHPLKRPSQSLLAFSYLFSGIPACRRRAIQQASDAF
jgi:hypothetical protein